MLATNNQIHLQSLRIGFLGAGSIVEAILNGIIKKELLPAQQIMVTNRSDRQRLDQLSSRFGICATADASAVIAHSDVLILGMKPKDVAEACLAWRGKITANHLIISVIAGVSTELINQWLDVECPVIRTMPNTSSAVGCSVTGLAKGKYATDQHQQLAVQLFEAIGSVYPVRENELDIITGLSGSGPAYVYYLVEAMQQAGVKAGLSPELTRQLTVQTLYGAAQMLLQTDEEPATLRHKITSPGGTTQAGLEVLDAHRFQQAVCAAVLRATERSRELGEQYR